MNNIIDEMEKKVFLRDYNGTHQGDKGRKISYILMKNIVLEEVLECLWTSSDFCIILNLAVARTISDK